MNRKVLKIIITLFIFPISSCKEKNVTSKKSSSIIINQKSLASDLIYNLPSFIKTNNITSLSKIVIDNRGFENINKVNGDTIYFIKKLNDSTIFEDTKWNRNTYHYNDRNILKSKTVVNDFVQSNKYEWSIVGNTVIKNNIYRRDSTIYTFKNEKLIYKEVYEYNSKTIKSFFYNQKDKLSHTSKVQYSRDFGGNPKKTETKYFWVNNKIKQIIEKSIEQKTIVDFDNHGVPIKEIYTYLNGNQVEFKLISKIKTIGNNSNRCTSGKK